MEKIILFYDNTCGFCQKVVQLSLKWVAVDNVFYAPLGGEEYQKMKKKNFKLPKKLDAIILLNNNKISVASVAFFELALFFKKPWYYLSFLKYAPDSVSNLIYSIIAKNRYLISKKVDVCKIPNSKDRKKFLL